ncbi:MAG: response regulator [Planctomycetota bacterium]
MPQPVNLLLVEDDPVDVMNVRRAIARAEFDCKLTVVADGPDALELLRRPATSDFPADRRVVLLDLNMPTMTGVEVLAEIRDDPALKPLPVVILSTSDQPRDRDAVFQLNAAGYLVKPPDPGAFADIISAIYTYWSQSLTN